MPARPAAVLLAAVLALAACGDDGDDATDTALDETTTTAVKAEQSTTSTTAAEPGGVEALVLRQSDFPAGWTSTPSDDPDDEAGEELERCLGVEVDDDQRPEAQSPDFSQGPLTQVSSSVSLAPDAASVDREFAALRGQRFLECAKAEFDKGLAEGADVEFAASTAETLRFADLGDGTVAARLTTSVTAGGEQVPIYADFVFVRKGLAELTFSFLNAGEPFPADLASDLVSKVLARA